jgi:hypothetical protein
MATKYFNRCYLVRINIGQIGGKPFYKRAFTVISNLEGQPVATDDEAKAVALKLLGSKIDFSISKRLRVLSPHDEFESG